MKMLMMSQCLKITEKVSFNIEKPKACVQKVLPDISLLIRQKMVENAKNSKMRHFLVIFKHCVVGLVFCIFVVADHNINTRKHKSEIPFHSIFTEEVREPKERWIRVSQLFQTITLT